MSTQMHISITDEMLAAYLDGSLSRDQIELVEDAIEKDEELQNLIDEYLMMADAAIAGKNIPMSSCEGEPIDSISSVIKKVKEQSHPISWKSRFMAAASVFVAVGAASLLIVKAFLVSDNMRLSNGSISSSTDAEFYSNTLDEGPVCIINDQLGQVLFPQSDTLVWNYLVDGDLKFSWSFEDGDCNIVLTSNQGVVLLNEDCDNAQMYRVPRDILLKEDSLIWTISFLRNGVIINSINGIILKK